MRFDSVVFLAFFVVAWSVWRLLPLRAAKFGTLALSLAFYGWWRWEYLALILFSAVVDYWAAARIDASEDKATRMRWLLVSLVSNLGLLAFFKYTPLIVRTVLMLDAPPEPTPGWVDDWIVPVGISFYTFQTLSYTIDVHRGTLKPCRTFVDFFLFVSFFPQLVAGPILRASELLPQLEQRAALSWPRVQIGLYRVVSGLFWKIVVADGLAVSVERIYSPARAAGASTLDAWLATACFGGQIYADFAGYSGIAIGLAHLMGLRFPENFRYPYIAASLSEFWKRWHISLSPWLRDYLYIPLGGNRHGKLRTYANLLVTMLLGGLWHGASWSFLAWGAIHGAGLAVEKALGLEGRNQVGHWPLAGARDFGVRCLRIVLVWALVHTAWVYFRAADFGTANALVAHMWLDPLRGAWGGASILLDSPQLLFLLPVVLAHAAQCGHEWLGVKKTGPMRVVLAGVYLALLLLVDRGEGSPFLYFQF